MLAGLGLGGCNSLLGTENYELAKCFGHLVSVCLDAPPTGDIKITSGIDTDHDARCVQVAQPDGPKLCVIAGNSISVTSNTTANGMLPLVLIGAATVDVTGTIDVDASDPWLEEADDVLRDIFQASLKRPLVVKETTPAYGTAAKKRVRRG